MTTSTLTNDMTATNPVTGNVPCPRCGGFMVADRFIDLLDDTGHLEFIAARCIACGEVLDPIILQNRHRAVPAKPAAVASDAAVEATPGTAEPAA